jgi:cytochrome o ubiquinol oxidase subunit II
MPLLDPAGPIGDSEKLGIMIAVGLMLLVVIPVFVLTGRIAWRYRAGSAKAVYAPNWSRCGSVMAWSMLCCVCTWLGFAGEAYAAEDVSFLDPHGPIAAAQQQHFIHVILLMMIVILPVLIGVPLLAWRYRYRNTSARYTPKWDRSASFEALIWGVPVAIVIILAIWQAHDTFTLDPYRPLKTADAPLKVDVIGYDWKWLFVYPQLHIASLGQLVIPEHTDIAMRLTSDSVMQSFFIPALGSQIYAMAAMQTKLHLVADSTGQFLGENTQYDGIGFQHQKFVACATTLQGFRDWVASVRANGIPLTAKVYSVIRERNTVPQIRAALKAGNMPPDAVFFKDAQPDLFWNVMMAFHNGASSSRAMVSASNARARMMANMGKYA